LLVDSYEEPLLDGIAPIMVAGEVEDDTPVPACVQFWRDFPKLSDLVVV
jgi:hypothetical protein